MANLVRFNDASQGAIQNFLSGTSLSNTINLSPGQEIEITGVSYRQAEFSDNTTSKNVSVVFTTNVLVDIFWSSLTRVIIRVDQTVFKPEGTFNVWFREKLTELRGKSNEEVITAIEKEATGMKLVVREDFIQGYNRDGSTGPRHVIYYDIVK